MKPLTGGRYRTKEVCDQVQDAMHGASVYNMETESLVCLLRHYREAGMAREADAAAAIIRQRALTQVTAWTNHYMPSSEPCHREQCAEHALGQMWDCLLSNAPGNEFWEICFWLCLKRRFVNALYKQRSKWVNERRLTTQGKFDDDCSYIDLAADGGIADTLSRIMMEEVLSAVPEHCLQALVKVMDGHEQAHIAKEYGVTDRSIRNWISRARKIVRAYYE